MVATWAARLRSRDLAVVAATSSDLVRPISPATVRRGDLLVRSADDSFWSYRLIPRRRLESSPA
jgi:hypothetical protein